jgi:large subunit ribosomal protein L21
MGIGRASLPRDPPGQTNKGLGMYAVVKTGGRQYRVEPGETIDVERLPGAVGDTVDLSDILMVGNGNDVTIGTPTLTEVHVKAEIIAHKRGDKIIVFKSKRRKNSRRKNGHRQSLTSLKITDIQA